MLFVGQDSDICTLSASFLCTLAECGILDSRRQDKTIADGVGRSEARRVSRRDKKTRPHRQSPVPYMASGWRAFAQITIGHKRCDFAQVPHSTYASSYTMRDRIRTNPAMGPSHHHSPQIRCTHPDHPSPHRDRHGRCLRPARCRELLHRPCSCSPETAGIPCMRPVRRR